MYPRKLPLQELVRSKSLILLGPRQTGKCTLLRSLPGNPLVFNLLDERYFREFTAHPELLRQRIPSSNQAKSQDGPGLLQVAIDEIQRIPALLNEVQLILDSRSDVTFVLTGSSARKLRRGHANLLGGRARFAELFPLVYPELQAVRLEERVIRGSLPSIIDSKEWVEDLQAYVGGYLKEEIQAESLVRNIGNFSRFLEIAALCNAEQVNFTQVGSDCNIAPRTVRDFFTLLEDTLIGRMLEPFSGTQKRKSVATPKFYFFDPGVVQAILGRKSISPQTPEHGKSVEHLIYQELRAWISYNRLTYPLRFWRSQSQHEVDFVVGDHLAVEVKAKTLVQPRDLRGIQALKEEKIFKHTIVVSLESLPRIVDGIEILPIENFLKRLWDGEWNL